MKLTSHLFPLICAIMLSGNQISAQDTGESESPESEGPGHFEVSEDAEDPVRIPFRMHKGKPLMELSMNGKKAFLMIDNGVLWDQVWLFGSPLIEELGLKPSEDLLIGGSGEGDPTQAYFSDNLRLEFQDIIFYEQPSIVSPAAAGFARMFPGTDGQLCNTFFKHFIVEFDFIQNVILLHDPKTFRYKGSGSVLKMKKNESGIYSVPFQFEMPDGKVYKDQVDIDFGGIYSLKIALNNKNSIQVPSNTKENESYGAQGKDTEYLAKIKSMTFGKYTFYEPEVAFGDEGTSRIHPDNLGVIGLPLFLKFDIIFDYFNNKMYIDPNENFDSSAQILKPEEI